MTTPHNLPQPESFVIPSTSPTKILNKPFTILTIDEVSYDGDPQLAIDAILHESMTKCTIYCSNRAVMKFLLALKPVLPELLTAMEFYKENSRDSFYKIAYSTEERIQQNETEQDELPF